MALPPIDVALAPYSPTRNPLTPRLRDRINRLLCAHFHIVDAATLVHDGSSAILAYVNDDGRLALAGFAVYTALQGQAPPPAECAASDAPPPTRDDTSVYIDWVLTLPKYRRRGVARSILRHVCLNARTTVLHADSEDEGAVALYSGLGFRGTGVNTREVVRDDGSCAVMVEMAAAATSCC